ncbi:MAG: EcoRII N-terminal effector-binding domain-containing protein [Gemmobacter sp.]
MGGVLVPKGDGELLAFLPQLNPTVMNPSAWIDCQTPDGSMLRLRFVYYNNRLHAPNGTRNEYRITYLTKFLRHEQATEGDTFEISRDEGTGAYRIRVIKMRHPDVVGDVQDTPMRIKLTSGWRRVHWLDNRMPRHRIRQGAAEPTRQHTGRNAARHKLTIAAAERRQSSRSQRRAPHFGTSSRGRPAIASKHDEALDGIHTVVTPPLRAGRFERSRARRLIHRQFPCGPGHPRAPKNIDQMWSP